MNKLTVSTQTMSNNSFTSITTLPSECELDECYENFKLQLQQYINSQCETSNVSNICKQWLEVFESATTEFQKVARNCFLVLMLEQLETYYTLAWPFTDCSSLERGIEELWANLSVDTMSNIEEIKQQAAMEAAAERLSGGLNVSQIVMDKIQNDKEQKEIDDSAKLRDTLNCLRVQFCEAKTKAIQLQEKIEQYELLQRDICEKTEMQLLKDNICVSVQTYLDKLRYTDKRTGQEALPMKVFEHIFQDLLANDADHHFHDAIRLCDIEFDVILNSYFHRKYKSRLEALIMTATRKLEKAKRSLRNKFTERLNFNAWASDLQVKLIRMKCFSALRNIFIDMRTGDSIKMQTMMNLLEESCRAIFEEAKVAE